MRELLEYRLRILHDPPWPDSIRRITSFFLVVTSTGTSKQQSMDQITSDSRSVHPRTSSWHPPPHWLGLNASTRFLWRFCSISQYNDLIDRGLLPEFHSQDPSALDICITTSSSNVLVRSQWSVTQIGNHYLLFPNLLHTLAHSDSSIVCLTWFWSHWCCSIYICPTSCNSIVELVSSSFTFIRVVMGVAFALPLFIHNGCTFQSHWPTLC